MGNAHISEYSLKISKYAQYNHTAFDEFTDAFALVVFVSYLSEKHRHKDIPISYNNPIQVRSLHLYGIIGFTISIS